MTQPESPDRPSQPPDPHELSERHHVSAFRRVPRTGVIYVMGEAARLGYSYKPDPGEDDWCNLGQGMPETGPLPGSPARVEQVSISMGDQEYAPVAGLWELREAVADLYNQAYRRGMQKYSAENVCVSGGGRTALTRAAAALGQINLGHFLPDYTAYEELLDVFRLFSPIPILLDGSTGYAFNVGDLRREILGRGLSAILMSNPCNPTGKHVRGVDLADWVGARSSTARCCSTSSTRTTSTASGARADGERRALRRGRRTRTLSSSSTASPRTGGTRAGA
jgi:N-succinyldiaminopimelate aminotransferase